MYKLVPYEPKISYMVQICINLGFKLQGFVPYHSKVAHMVQLY